MARLPKSDKVTKEARNKKIFELWLACYTQEEIAVVVNISQREVGRTLDDIAGLPKLAKVAADHLVDFTPPIYNVWKFKDRTTGNSHFGNTVAVN